MPHRLALTVLALAAAFLLAFPVFTARAAPLDEWCAQVTVPASIAICSAPDLRALAIERQHAFDGARARVGEARYGALLADQKAWVVSYTRACGIERDVAPSLPLPSVTKDCMVQAGRARIAYLKGYGISTSGPSDPTTATVGMRIGPGFDCAVAAAPLAQLICADAELPKTDLRFNQAYQALRQSLDPAGRQRLATEDVEFLNSVKLGCGVPEAGAVAGSGECVAAHYNRKRAEWISRLSGAALEEANRPIEQHVALQAQLQRINFLQPTAKIDGVYSAGTRSAITAWQNASGRPATGFIGDADAVALGSAAPQQSASQPSTSPLLSGLPRPSGKGATEEGHVAPVRQMAASPSSLLQPGMVVPAPPNASQNTLRGDPLLDAVHKELMKRALDLCSMPSRARELCSNGSPGVSVEDCRQNLTSSASTICPDGPEKLVAWWEANQRSSTINFQDFVLDKEVMARSGEYGVGKSVMIRGVYIRAADSMDYLLAPGKINPMAYGRDLNSDTSIPLLLDDSKSGGTNRETRAALLTCREKHPPTTFTGCSVWLGGFVQKCQITMQITGASHETVCIKVSDVTVDPRD